MSIKLHLLLLILFSSGTAITLAWVQWNWSQEEMKSQLEVQQSELNLNRLVHFGRELDVITTSGDLLFGNGVSYLSEQIARQYSQIRCPVAVPRE